ncbi:MAG: Coenzyme F420 hydrogenase/dehydrogenase, beta subunit C-terminal domain, partial [Fusobacteriaceae bacterium]
MNKSAIEVIGYDRCTGCYGCLNSCPVEGAIQFKKTEEGFYKPFLTEKCIQCGMCRKGCPVIQKVNNNSQEDLKVYSCWSKDSEIVKNSSSGGIFSELAKHYLEQDGVVFGAKWQDGEIVHSGITKLEELKELQKSKYLQSKVEMSYSEVKRYLKLDKKVLFVGTPCQIAALNTLVNHENLITVDLICHGIPSYSAYEKYIRENFNLNIRDVTVDFRNKDTGWENFNLTFKNKDQIIIQ